MAPPIVALLTDFGLRDHYVGTMKAVILGGCPEATLVDITHEIAPQDVFGGALELAASYRYFPAGTVFLVVVDPGVGSGRRAIAAEAGGYRFVAPDNGVLGPTLDEHASRRMVSLPEMARASRTFEGRDRLAPAAARLAKGEDIARVGAPAGHIQRVVVPAPRATADGIDGEVIRIDRYGNLMTNITRAAVESLARGSLVVDIGGCRVPAISATYAEVAPGTLCALFDSVDRLEVAVANGNAAGRLRVGRGAAVRVRPSA